MEAKIIEGEIINIEPFVHEGSFYCQPDFESPLICFVSGVALPENSSPSVLSSKQTTKVMLYFDPKLINSSFLSKLFNTSFIFLIMFIVIAASVLFMNGMLAFILGLAIIYFIIPKSKRRTTVNDVSNGFLCITGGHPDFLKHYPKRNAEEESSNTSDTSFRF